jgi:predicted phage baseplate assembly protein
MTQDGFLEIAFGDGFHGRRLPTGTNNVRINYRVGTGLVGNLSAGSLIKPKHASPLVDSILQPLSASGGNAMEDSESLRSNAPASTLALERAVSLADFTHLATRYSSVWQARGFVESPGAGRRERITLMVVPAGGGPLGELEQDLRNYLLAHALPGVEVQVNAYRPVYLRVHITVRVKSDEFVPDDVVAAVDAALRSRFTLRNARLGETFYDSSLFQVVEQVTGVENSDCIIEAGTLVDGNGAAITVQQVLYTAAGAIKQIRPLDDQMVYLEPDVTAPVIDVAEFVL